MSEAKRKGLISKSSVVSNGFFGVYSLGEISSALWLKKKLIIIITLSCMIFSTGYAFTVPSTWKTTAVISLPNLSSFNDYSKKIDRIEKLIAFHRAGTLGKFQRMLSKDLMLQVFYNEFNSKENQKEFLNQNLNININDVMIYSDSSEIKRSKVINVSLSVVDANGTDVILKNYIEYVSHLSSKKLDSIIDEFILNEIDSFEMKKEIVKKFISIKENDKNIPATYYERNMAQLIEIEVAISDFKEHLSSNVGNLLFDYNYSLGKEKDSSIGKKALLILSSTILGFSISIFIVLLMLLRLSKYPK